MGMKNPLYRWYFVQWIFSLFHPLDLPPLLNFIYIKLFIRIVFSEFLCYLPIGLYLSFLKILGYD